MAWIQSRYQLQQLNDAERDSATSIAAAKLAVAQAQYQQNLTDQNAYSTSLDRQQAALAVAQAEEQLTSVQQSATETAAEAHLEDKKGVVGSQTVVQAQQAVQDALYGVKQAQEQLADAQRNLTDTELNDAEQVKAAQLAVTQAQQQSAYQQQSDAIAVAQAQQNLTDTLKEQQLQQNATLSTENSAANQFAKDMAALSPSGREFVDTLLSMRGAWKGLETAAQTSVMPGMLLFLDGIKSLMPEITQGARLMGGAISSAFGSFGKQMVTPAFAHVFDGLIANGVQFANIVLPAFAQFIQELARIGSGKGAVDGLAGLLAGIGHGLTGLAAALAPSIPAINSFLASAGHIIAAIGPPLGAIVGWVARALGPLTRYLDSHPNGTVVKVIGDILAGLLAFKGLQKLVSGPVEALVSLPGKISGIGGKIGKVWSAMGSGYLKVFGEGGLISRGASGIGGMFSKLGSGLSSTWETIQLKAMYAWEGISGAASSAWGGIASFGSKFGSMMSSAASSVASFVSTMATQLAEAATATGAWIAEHAVAAASFIAENVTMAASATAAFIAENAATLGLGAAIAALVGAVVYMGTHWKQTWDAMKDAGEAVWNDALKPVFDAFGSAVTWLYNNAIKPYFDLTVDQFKAVGDAGTFLWQDVLEPAWHGIEAGATAVYTDAIKPYFSLVVSEFQAVETAAMWMWHNVFDPVYQGILTGTRDFVSGIGTAWHALGSVFSKPVNFLINDVYMGGIRTLWDDVVQAIGLKSLKLPVVNPITMATGGVISKHGVVPGYSPGNDTRLAAVSPGEAWLTPQATEAIGGKSAIDAINSAYPPSSARPGRGGLGHTLDKLAIREVRKHTVERGAEHMLGFAGGGVVPGWLSHGLSDVGHFLGGAFDVGKMIAAIATGNTTAFTNAASKMIGTHAAGDLGKIMVGIPKTLVTDMAKALVGDVSSQQGTSKLPAGGSGAVGNLPANWKTIATFLSTRGFTKYAAAGVTGNVDQESGGDPEILEIGGGGGGGLIQWTPYPPGYITGNYQADLMTQLNAILSWGGGPSIVNRATSPSNAAEIYQDLYERPASLTASLPGRMASANAVYEAMGWGKFDQGGWLMPGGGGYNTGGQPEAVLTPDESAALKVLARQALNGGAAAPAPQITVQYFGTQVPSPEMQAEINRGLAMQLSGA